MVITYKNNTWLVALDAPSLPFLKHWQTASLLQQSNLILINLKMSAEKYCLFTSELTNDTHGLAIIPPFKFFYFQIYSFNT